MLPIVGSESVSPIVYVDQLVPSVDFYRYNFFAPSTLSRRTVLLASCAVKQSGFAIASGSGGVGGIHFSQVDGNVLAPRVVMSSASGHLNVPVEATPYSQVVVAFDGFHSVK